MASILSGWMLRDERVPRVDADLQQEAPSGVLLGRVKDVRFVGGAGRVRCGGLAEINALIVDNVTRLGEFGGRNTGGCHRQQEG